ncbi:MAG: chemotaxis-specific protein-glutamate methyltransferase CheB [Candidatus Coatesbacteria bacterium]
MIRVLVADDSAFARKALTRMLEAEPDIRVVATARDGIEAVERTVEYRPDVVTLDLDMPRMDGLTALAGIMERSRVPVLVVSAAGGREARDVFRALALGAVDFVEKTVARGPIGILDIGGELVGKVRAAAGRHPAGHFVPAKGDARAARGAARTPGWKARALVVGSSTGGPAALELLLGKLAPGLAVPVLVVQHMPPSFVGHFAEHLGGHTRLKVRAASHGDRTVPGEVLLAPGDQHMVVAGSGKEISVRLAREAAGAVYLPSVDVTMRSAAAAFAGEAVGVLLTGMGNDGTEGMRALKAAGGRTLVQDEASSAVFGMARSAIEAGVVDEVVSLDGMAAAIRDAL